MVTIVLRTIVWTFRVEPLSLIKPLPPLTNGIHKSISPDANSEKHAEGLTTTAWNALDLMFNLRGIGWTWSKGLRFPPETRPTNSTPAFLLATMISFVQHVILLDGLQYIVQSFSPSTFGSPAGGTIFDPSLPPFHRYARSSLITMLSGLVIYCAIRLCYDFCTLCGIILFRQYPAQWPPIFNQPWQSTSVSDFWAKRWHQVFRDSFMFVGGRPMDFFAGRLGSVIGVFFVSGLLHDLGLWGMGRGTDFWHVVGFFSIMGVGVVIEAVWRNTSGTKVHGWIGWAWTMLWVIGWGNLVVDAWLRSGLAGSIFMPESRRPGKIFIDYITSNLYKNVA
jgi:Membrane bound O-acyl transferase family